MIQLTRSLLRQFRTVFHKLPPSQLPPVVSFRAGKHGLSVRLHRTDVLAEYHQAGNFGEGEVALQLKALADLEAKNDNSITLETTESGTVLARWEASGLPQAKEYESEDLGHLPTYPQSPKRLTAMGPGFMQAMHDASQSAASDTVRFALNHLLLKGKERQVVATDGHQLLVQDGFTFPWQDNILIPALQVFGCRELGEVATQLGKTDKHVVMQIGSWTLHLPIHTKGRYPGYQEVIPKKSPASRWLLDDSAVVFLSNTLRQLPGDQEQHSPVTVDLDEEVAIRAKDENQGNATEFALTGSRYEGKAVRFVINRHILKRALDLGFREFQIIDAEVPGKCCDESRTFVFMPLSKASAVQATQDAVRIPCNADASTTLLPKRASSERRSSTMAKPSTNGTADNGVHTNQSKPTNNKINNTTALIQEAMDLKAALRDVYTRTHKLVVALRKQKKQQQAVQTTLASLRQLQQIGE